MSQSLRNRRSEEAQALIAQRTTDAKAMFEPSTCTGAYASQASAAFSEQTNLKGTASQAEAPAVQNNHGAALASSPTKLTYTRNQLQDAQTTCLGAAPPEPAHNQSWEDEGMQALLATAPGRHSIVSALAIDSLIWFHLH
ncbi:uncharacterized protein LOC144123189 [Amblyomma americanum]